MNKLKSTLNNIFKSMYYGVLIPVFVEVQTVIEHGTFEFSWELISKIFIGSIVAYLVKKGIQASKGVDKLSVAKGGDDRTLPPPMGDPTHPKK